MKPAPQTIAQQLARRDIEAARAKEREAALARLKAYGDRRHKALGFAYRMQQHEAREAEADRQIQDQIDMVRADFDSALTQADAALAGWRTRLDARVTRGPDGAYRFKEAS